MQRAAINKHKRAQSQALHRAPHVMLARTPVAPMQKGSQLSLTAFAILERDKRLELSTYTLARYRSTN
jgi:predicted membrane metal-binding protein